MLVFIAHAGHDHNHTSGIPTQLFVAAFVVLLLFTLALAFVFSRRAKKPPE